ncbi:hypothetical protein B8W90_13680, partial [Staphylococcus hominis]
GRDQVWIESTTSWPIMTDNKNKTSALPALAIDKTRASKAGHAYHEAWAARSALELLMPSTDLSAITLEGFNEA